MKIEKIANHRRTALQLLAIALAMVGCTVQAQITGEVRDGKLVMIASEPTELVGLDLISADGLLVPVPEDPGPAPFSFFLSNTENQITWGNLGTRVTLDGEWETAAGYLGDDPLTDLSASWGGAGAQSIAFPVSVVPEPTSGLMACFGVLGFLGFRARRNPGVADGFSEFNSQICKEGT